MPVEHRENLVGERLTGEPGDKVARTVIVDECSMLTEEMMAALLEALSGVHRLILLVHAPYDRAAISAAGELLRDERKGSA